MDDHHVGLRELLGGREGVAPGGFHAPGVEQRNPITKEGWMVMVAGAVGLRSGADEDAERGGGIRWCRGIGSEGGDNGEQG